MRLLVKCTTGTSSAPYRIYNIGNNSPVELLEMISIVEQCLGRKAEKRFLPLQPGDVPETYADVDDLVRDTGFKPSTPLSHGIARFVERNGIAALKIEPIAPQTPFCCAACAWACCACNASFA